MRVATQPLLDYRRGMRTESFVKFLKDTEARAQASGVADVPAERLRNRGFSRTPAKRAALAAAADRARAADVEPIRAYY